MNGLGMGLSFSIRGKAWFNMTPIRPVTVVLATIILNLTGDDLLEESRVTCL